jgi:hypothetical protein
MKVLLTKQIKTSTSSYKSTAKKLESRPPISWNSDNREQKNFANSFQEMANNSEKVKRADQLQNVANNYSKQLKSVTGLPSIKTNIAQLDSIPNYSNNNTDVIQRVVESVQDRGQTYYRSSFDTRKYFATKAEAQAHEDYLIAQMSFPSFRDRAPTAFTFAQTPMSQSIGSGASRQGPHVFAEVGMNRAFEDMDRTGLDAAAKALPPPDVTRTRFDVEMAQMDEDDERSARVDRFDERYRQLYGLAQDIDPDAHKGGKKTKATNARRNVLKMAANMSAFGTYGYQEEEPHEHEDWAEMIKGKGEKATASADKLYDDHAEDFVQDEDAFEEENEMRRKMLARRKLGKK